MSNIRIIARLDVKGPNLIKGIHLEGLRVLGSPNQFARRYYEQGVDEIIYMDIVASLYNRNNLSEIVEKATEDIFIPLAVGGGIRTLEDATKLLRSGADKITVNTQATKTPNLITDIAKSYGAQCVVLSVEAKKVNPGKWEAFTDNGREYTGLDVVEWVKRAEDKGAGEVLLTSVDCEGTQKGFDLELINQVCNVVKIPVIASGGMGNLDHFKEAVDAGANAVSIAHVLHYNKLSIQDIREFAFKNNIPVREL